MATKNQFLSFNNDKPETFGFNNASNGQYSNLNLNQNKECFFENTVISSNCIVTNESRTFAYENSVDNTSDSKNGNENAGIKENKEEMELIKKWKNFDSAVKAVFELPRQQEGDKMDTPEVMQFKASQQLVNPNQAPSLSNNHQNFGIIAHSSQYRSPNVGQYNQLPLPATGYAETLMKMNKKDHHLAIGSFIMHNGDRGYIRYYGEVQGYDGIWYGIEWENYTKRGKHNGTVKGIKYFESSHPKGASFIRATENISDGEDIVSLIIQRYDESAVKYKASVNKIDIELEDNQIQQSTTDENLSKVFAITLDRYPLAFCKTLNKAFPACKDLVISNTLLTKWSNIFEILKLFPNLRLLDISNNLLEKLSDLGDLENIAIKNPIKTLKVNQCNMDDESVYRLLLLFPDIVEFHLTGNSFKSISIPSHYSTLETLYLQDNDIITFDNLRSLGSLPKLKYLNISNCKLSKITVTEPFVALEKLVVAENKFLHWEDITDVNKFPNLKQVVLQTRLPVPKGMDSREVMVVKFPNIIELDRLDISPVFRRNCEYDFMNKISSLNPIPFHFNADIQRLQKIYPDFEVEIHDPHSLPSNVIDKETIKLRFVYGSMEFEKVFDSTQDFSQILKIVCRKMKLPTRGIEVYIRRYQKKEDEEDKNGYGETEEHVKYLNSNIKSYDLDANSTVVLKISE